MANGRGGATGTGQDKTGCADDGSMGFGEVGSLLGDQTLETVSRLGGLCQVSGPGTASLSDRRGVCGGRREEVETRVVRDALTEGLLEATLTFRLDRGPQRSWVPRSRKGDGDRKSKSNSNVHSKVYGAFSVL